MIRVKGYIMQQSNGDVCLDEVSDRDPKKIMSLSIIKCGYRDNTCYMLVCMDIDCKNKYIL